ncbi:unnamed protein product [Linum trigynum]|uniref:Uncharacterized protein n=1 Tax=Linum trigynum TaxID=586398 RepID=A0AAV2FQW6_9ROSI
MKRVHEPEHKIATCSAKIPAAIFDLQPLNLTGRSQPQVHERELWSQGCELQKRPTQEKQKFSTIKSWSTTSVPAIRISPVTPRIATGMLGRDLHI